jgi:hypothetical protein
LANLDASKKKRDKGSLGKAAFLSVIFLVSVTRGFSSDDRREGFILGAGAGPGFTMLFFSPTYRGFDFVFQPYFSFQIDLRIGFGFSKNLSLCLLEMISLTDFGAIGDGYEWFFGLGDWLAVAWLLFPFIPVVGSQMLVGPEATWYFEPEAPSWFITGALGVYLFFNKIMSGLREGSIPGTGGGGIRIGVGYEFKELFTVAFTCTSMIIPLPAAPNSFVLSCGMTVAKSFL